MLLVKKTSFPWLGAGIPLSTKTHIFHRIDPKVPIPWFHLHNWWVPWTTWEESLVPLGMVVSHVLEFNSIITPLRFIQGLFRTILGQRPRMSPDFSTLVVTLKGPKQVMSLMIFGLRWRQWSNAPAVLRYTFMIDPAYLYHKDFDSQSGSPYSYVTFQIQQTINHEDIAFHENAMGPMYHISIVFNLTWRQPSL